MQKYAKDKKYRRMRYRNLIEIKKKYTYLPKKKTDCFHNCRNALPYSFQAEGFFCQKDLPNMSSRSTKKTEYRSGFLSENLPQTTKNIWLIRYFNKKE